MVTLSHGRGGVAAVNGATRGLAGRLCASSRRKIVKVADGHAGVYILVNNAGRCSQHAAVLRGGMHVVQVCPGSPGQLDVRSLFQAVIHASGSSNVPSASTQGRGAAAPLTNGAVFAGFKIVHPLGSGGMGEVYLAEHPRLPRHEALKILPVEVSGDQEYRARFTREADLAAALWHPHIVGVHDRGEHAGRLWISMDYVDGADCARLLRERYPAGMPRGECWRSSGRWPRRWTMRTIAACCIATSNRPTSCSPTKSRAGGARC